MGKEMTMTKPLILAALALLLPPGGVWADITPEYLLLGN
jgi:hypothetical protein